MKCVIKTIISKVLPPSTKRRNTVKRIIGRQKNHNASTSTDYQNWILEQEPGLFEDNKEISKGPLISIVVPCFNTPQKYIDPLIMSVKGQKYTNWQLCLTDGSTDQARSKYLELSSKQDDRITYKKVGQNLGIVGNTNFGLSVAKGKYIAFMDHDDTLSPYALSEVAQVIDRKPGTDLIYSDEDKLSDDGKVRTLPFFKPDWSPEMLLGVNYITHFVVVRASLIKKISGLRPGFDGAQDYDFLLRLTENTNNIEHISKILYHWRLADGSTAKDVGEKKYADTAGQRALKDAVKRRGLKANVIEIPERPTNYRLRYILPKKEPKVSIIIPFKDKVELLEVCIPSILASPYSNFEIILISNNSVEQKTHDYLKSLNNEKRCKIFIWDQPFNYSAINNFGRKQAAGEYLIFLNNDTEVLNSNWIEELVGVASQNGIGAVGPLLLYQNKTIQHAGVILGMNTMAGHAFRFRIPEEWTDYGMAVWPRNYLAVTGACMVVKGAKFDEVGGFDEELTVGGNDVALCLSLYEKGYRNVYWPFVRITHYENVSVGPYASSVPIGDYNRSLVYYRHYLDNGDPYFNVNLDLMNEQIGIKG